MHCFIARLGVEGIIQIANLCFLPMVFLFYSDLKQIRTFVAKRREMSNTRFFGIFFDSNKCNLTQTLLRHLFKKMVSGASGLNSFQA